MRRSAFTMIELIFVIVILGILAAVALPRFAGIQDDANIASEESGIGSIRSSLQAIRGKAILSVGTDLNITVQDQDGLFYQIGFGQNTGVAGNQQNEANLSIANYPNALSIAAWQNGNALQSGAGQVNPQIDDNPNDALGTTSAAAVLEPEGRSSYRTYANRNVINNPAGGAPAIIGGVISYIKGPATNGGVSDPNAKLCNGKGWQYNPVAGIITTIGECIQN